MQSMQRRAKKMNNRGLSGHQFDGMMYWGIGVIFLLVIVAVIFSVVKDTTLSTILFNWSGAFPSFPFLETIMPWLVLLVILAIVIGIVVLSLSFVRRK